MRIQRFIFLTILFIGMNLMAKAQNSNGKKEKSKELNRTVLPIPQTVPPVVKEPDIQKAQLPDRQRLTAPVGAPNVLIVLIDDMGFGQPSAFGGPIDMPTFARISNEGLRYNRFHTAAICSASRAALLTGNNTHTANSGEIADISTGFEGNTFVKPDNITPLAQILRMNGYSTAQFGKCHEVPNWETTPVGPFDRWPTGQGFEKFYGFIGGESNNWAPNLYDGTTKIELNRDSNYHLTTDMANKTIEWLGIQNTFTPDKPFFVYFAPGATHAPHHAPKEWADKYKGKFDKGWDYLRQETFERQKQLGIIPADSKISERPKEIPAWDNFTEEEHKLFARQMEVFAGFASHTDYEVGRILDYLEQIGELDNTIIVFIAGDNGASSEGGNTGTYNETAMLNGVPGDVKQMQSLYDEWGGPLTNNHYAMGWAWAGNTPYPWVKQIAGHLGGTRVGMAIRYPKMIEGKGEIRNQFYHVIDVAPTILDIANIPQPKMVNGFKQKPMDGVSMAATFTAANAPENHLVQYFNIFGNRGIYANGWMASTIHNVPWIFNANLKNVNEDKWELYNLNTDFTQSTDLAASNPKKLEEMLAIFNREAIKYKVYPIDDRKAPRVVPAIAGRPDLLNGRKEMNFYSGMKGLPEQAVISVKNVEFTVTCDISVNTTNDNGVLIAQGGRFAGWTIFVKDGVPVYEHNFFGLERYQTVSTEKLSPGTHSVVVHFTPDDPKKLGCGGNVTIMVDGKEVAKGRTEKMVYGLFSSDEALDIGLDEATPVSLDYKEEDNAFTGMIQRVNIQVK